MNGFKFMLRALRYRNYRLYFLGQSVSLNGSWMQMIAISWLIYRLTNSAFLLGAIGFISQIPAFIFSPFAGVFVDRWNRRKIIFITQTLLMVQAFLFAVLTFTGVIKVWHIVFLSVFMGLVNSFDMPARQAFVIDMVEKKEDLGNAIALNSSIFNGSRLVGSSLAGVVIAVLGEAICFLLNALSFLAVIFALWAMKIKRREMHNKNNILQELKEGFSYVVGFAPIRYILLLVVLVSMLGMSCAALMPIFAKDILHGGAHTLGFLMGAIGLGALVGALHLASRKDVRGMEKIIPKSTIIFGISLIAFSFCNLLWLSLFLAISIGFGMMAQTVASNTLLQNIADDDKRGRVMSFYTIAFAGMMPFGSLIAGSLASKVGAANTLLISGLSCILGAVFFAGKLRTIDEAISGLDDQKFKDIG
ncbi:MAG: MFS transporter [Candidatus Omnitrophica bacterium CG07_land_8_20_14_0_80_42_15]|uniref:MFS transporter n=1 Tax=Candidatus Aquitaenariimonas noxiae TaxID=1974741 RepID=A0A2J0KUE4_9BACT|nr:MAG: MFS transporter [Candidatus Omnitrophica bacterium CG07_land_8_20_14_0_80_42_15]